MSYFFPLRPLDALSLRQCSLIPVKSKLENVAEDQFDQDDKAKDLFDENEDWVFQDDDSDD
jgi:hypothetical protein